MKNIHKNIQRVTCCMLMVAGFTACRKSEDVMTSTAKPEKEIVEFLGPNSNVERLPVIHLFSDTVYTLSQSITRREGEQLVIDEGTLIKVKSGGQAVDITIQKGAFIIANGTRENPIVFTSNELPGNQKKNWGGIIIQGKSVNNSSNPAGDQNDFSGSLNFVRVEFAGLVLNSVGNATILNHVQVSYANPVSSFVFDGGSFDARNLVSYACGGAADFYITNGYSGKLQYILAERHPFFGMPGSLPNEALAGVFIENNAIDPAGATPETFPTISNLTVFGPNDQNGSTTAYTDTTIRSAGLVTTGNAKFRIRNSLFAGFPKAAWYIDEAATGANVEFQRAEMDYSMFQSNDHSRTFYLKPGSYPPYSSNDFRNFMMNTGLKNKEVEEADELLLTDPYNYEAGPDLSPKANSPLLSGAGFDGLYFTVTFFEKVDFVGALGTDNWLNNWTNFTPLKTRYNVPE